MAGRRAPHMRARDTDRTAVCQILDGALAEGQLTGEEHRQRIAAATSARTLGELQSLTTDLQSTTPTGQPSRSAGVSRRRWLLAAGACGLLAVVVAVVVATTGSDAPPAPSGPVAQPVAESPVAPTEPAPSGSVPDGVEPSVVAMPTEFHTVDGMTALLDTIRQRFGDTTGIELAIWREDAMLLRPDPTDGQVKQLYRFNNGWGDPSGRPRDPEDQPSDLGAFDVAATVEALRAAPETLGIPAADVSDVVVDIDHTRDPGSPGSPGALELMIKVSSTSGDSGFVYLDSAGAVTRVEQPS